MHLYKYRSLRDESAKQHVSATLLHQEIYFARHTEFNDLFDCNIHVSPVADPVTSASRDRKLHPHMSDRDIAALAERELDPARAAEIEENVRNAVSCKLAGIGIFSLSSKPDDLLMWSYYADGHRGICLQFALQESKLFGCEVTEVGYEEQYPRLSVYDKPTLDYVRRYLSTKAKAWGHEAEWRIIWQKPGVNQFPPEYLTGVILGARISPEDRTEILRLVTASRAKPMLYHARAKVASFGVDVLPLVS
jgi:hypothetical protein